MVRANGKDKRCNKCGLDHVFGHDTDKEFEPWILDDLKRLRDRGYPKKYQRKKALLLKQLKEFREQHSDYFKA